MKGERDALARGLSDTALLGLGSVLGAVLGLVSLRLLLTHLSEEDYGRYCLFLVVGGGLTVLLHWPTHGMLRLGTEEFEAREGVGRTYGSILFLVLASLTFVAVGAFFYRRELDALVGHPSWGTALVFAALSALAMLSYSALQPTGKVGLRTLFPAVPRAFYAGLLVLVTVGQSGLTLDQALLLCTATIAPAVVLPLIVIGRRLGTPSLDRELTRRALDFGWPLLIRNMGISGVLYVDLLVIQAFLGPTAAGRYDVAYRIAEQAIVLAMILEYVVGPVLATAAARRDSATLQRFYRLLAPQLVWAWCLGAALLVVLAEPILLVLGAKSPHLSAGLLELLAVVVALRGAMSLEVAVFDAHLLSRWPTVFFFLGFLLNLGADVGLLRAGWGLTGPALGTIAGFAFQAALRAIYLQRRLGVPAWRPYLGCAPVLVLLAVDRASDGSLAVGLLTWVGVACAVLFGGRRLGLFPVETRAYLERIRMPGLLRRGLVRLYGGQP